MLTDILTSLFGLVGIVLLAVPAIHADRYGLKISKLARMTSPIKSPLADEIKADAMSSLERVQFDWSWKLSACLRAGTLLTVLSQVLALYKAILTYNVM